MKLNEQAKEGFMSATTTHTSNPTNEAGVPPHPPRLTQGHM